MVSRIVSILAWATSALIMLPIMLYANIAEKHNGGYTCNVLWPDMPTSGFSFTIYSLVLGFIIPLCFIMNFYCLVIRKLRSMAKKTNKSKWKIAPKSDKTRAYRYNGLYAVLAALLVI